MPAGLGVKPFTAIMLIHEPFTNKLYREYLQNKFFYNHPKCIFFEISTYESIAYYTDPIYAAILIEKSKHHYCKIGILKDCKSRKLHSRTLTVQKPKIQMEYQQCLTNQKHGLLQKHTVN